MFLTNRELKWETENVKLTIVKRSRDSMNKRFTQRFFLSDDLN